VTFSLSKLDTSTGVHTAPAGISIAGIERVKRIFYRQMEEGQHPGAQLVVLRFGQVVVDLASGLADLRTGRPVTPDTPFLTWSVSKAFTGMCIHRLIEEGVIEWDAPVADYWPEFGRYGKETATIRQVLLHQAGIPSRGIYFQALHWMNWKRVTRNVANLKAEYIPGSKTAYHPLNYGFILGEVVRRVTGMPVEKYLQSTFLEPLGLKHTSLGLPPEWRREASQVYCGCRDQRLVVWGFSLPFIRSAVLPAATLHSTARDLAVFYQMLLNGGEYAGRRNLLPQTIFEATALAYEGFDHTMQREMRWAYGFHLGGLPRKPGEPGTGMGKGSSEKTFGHFGQRTCMAWADFNAQLVVTFNCNRLLSLESNQSRWQQLSDAIWDALVD
jgi:CubicO group peptidase (beta-lactamase class C family)